MAEQRGYTCDGGCGKTLAIDAIHDSAGRHGWWVMLSPVGYPTLHTCSTDCGVRALQGLGARALRSAG